MRSLTNIESFSVSGGESQSWTYENGDVVTLNEDGTYTITTGAVQTVEVTPGTDWEHVSDDLKTAGEVIGGFGFGAGVLGAYLGAAVTTEAVIMGGAIFFGAIAAPLVAVSVVLITAGAVINYNTKHP